MENRESYKDIMRKNKMNRSQPEKNMPTEVYVETILNELLLEMQRERLREKIDQSLDNRDYQAFMALSNELNAIRQ